MFLRWKYEYICTYIRIYMKFDFLKVVFLKVLDQKVAQHDWIGMARRSLSVFRIHLDLCLPESCASWHQSKSGACELARLGSCPFCGCIRPMSHGESHGQDSPFRAKPEIISTSIDLARARRSTSGEKGSRADG